MLHDIAGRDGRDEPMPPIAADAFFIGSHERGSNGDVGIADEPETQIFRPCRIFDVPPEMRKLMRVYITCTIDHCAAEQRAAAAQSVDVHECGSTWRIPEHFHAAS